MPRHQSDTRDYVISETRTRLLQAAAEAFAAKGYDLANVNHISQAAGFATGTIYNYFPSKRDLMHAFIDEAADLHVGAITSRVRQTPDSVERVRIFFEAGFAYVEENIVRSQAIFNTLYGPDEDFKARIGQAYRPLFDLLSQEVLVSGTASGHFRPLEPGPTAALIMTIYLGTGSQFGPGDSLIFKAGQVADFVLRALQKGDLL